MASNEEDDITDPGIADVVGSLAQKMRGMSPAPKRAELEQLRDELRAEVARVKLLPIPETGEVLRLRSQLYSHVTMAEQMWRGAVNGHKPNAVKVAELLRYGMDCTRELAKIAASVRSGPSR